MHSSANPPSESAATQTTGPALRLRGAGLRFGPRTLWHSLDLDVRPGEVIAIIGANGSGKSSLLKCILGVESLSEGTVEVCGEPVHRGDRRFGYVPQQNLVVSSPGVRGRDLVALGVDGDRFGLPWPSRTRRARVDQLIARVDGTAFANRRLSELSGGEQQRLRVAQALASDPRVLLCDEPLLSLDLPNQNRIVELIDRARKEDELATLFVTHDINPVLPIVSRVLYLARGQFRIGTPDEVFRSEVLSELYDAPVDVIESHGRIIVVGAVEDHHGGDHPHPHRGHDEHAHDHDHDTQSEGTLR